MQSKRRGHKAQGHKGAIIKGAPPLLTLVCCPAQKTVAGQPLLLVSCSPPPLRSRCHSVGLLISLPASTITALVEAALVTVVRPLHAPQGSVQPVNTNQASTSVRSARAAQTNGLGRLQQADPTRQAQDGIVARPRYNDCRACKTRKDMKVAKHTLSPQTRHQCPASRSSKGRQRLVQATPTPMTSAQALCIAM